MLLVHVVSVIVVHVVSVIVKCPVLPPCAVDGYGAVDILALYYYC